jgi:hypothetical protein
MHSYYNTKSLFHQSNRKIDYFCHKNLTNLITHQKISKNSNINITSKLGWVYANNVIEFFLIPQKLFHLEKIRESYFQPISSLY